MADNLSPLVNLDLINQIYKAINAQITERVYDPQYNSEATLGSEGSKYKSAWINGDTSTGTLNGLTLKKADTGIGFIVSGGDTSRTLTVADTTTISKPLEVTAVTSIAGSLTVSAATNIIQGLTIGATDTGTVTIKSGGKGNTTIVGPDSLEAILVDGTYTTSATTENSTTPEENKLLKIKKVDAKTFLAGPENGSNDVPDYRSIKATDLPEASVSANGIVTTGSQTFAGVKTFSETIKGSINGNAATADQVKTEKTDTNTNYHVSFVKNNNDTASKETVYTSSKLTYNPSTNTLSAASFTGAAAKTAHSISITDGADKPVAAIDGWNGSADNTLTIKGDINSPIATTATDSTITITHAKKGPNTTADTSKGDITNQAPDFGETFKVTSATVDAYGHTTALAEHTVTIPSTEASEKVSGIVTTGNQTFKGTKTFSDTIDGSINGNAATTDQVKTIKTDSNASCYISFVNNNNTTATKETVYTNSKLTYNPSTGTLSATTFSGTASKLAHSLSVKDGASTPVIAINGWNGSADETLTIKGDSPVTTSATANVITVTHDKKGPSATAEIGRAHV